MDGLRDDVVRIAGSCERAARAFERETASSAALERLRVQVQAVHKSWSGSWLGYHARIYIDGLQPRQPDETFDSEWGTVDALSNATRGRWALCDEDWVTAEILRRSGLSEDELCEIEESGKKACAIFEEARDEILSSLDAVLATNDDPVLSERRDDVATLRSHISESDFVQAKAPSQVWTRDNTALSEGLRTPPHFQLEVRRVSLLSYGLNMDALAKHARYVERYLGKRLKMSGKSVARTDGKIFIGHGRSAVWRELKDFIQDRLKLPWEEFNREPTAGMATKERLEDMLDASSFAFLVMRAEDDHSNGTRHARASVIHEVGLFQGRLGFERAIVLLEDGCEEFSNIVGVSQIRFPKGKVSVKFEEIRRVLEREKIIRSF